MERRKPLGRRVRLRAKKEPEPRRKPLASVSAKRRRENAERRRSLRQAYGTRPRCTLCEPLRAAGIDTGCNGWADDGDEILRRSAGGSIIDPANVRPVGRRCHDWIGAHPARARELGLVRSRYDTPGA